MAKPFSPKEIAYRVKAQLRRAAYQQDPSEKELIKTGELEIDVEGCRVTKGGSPIELTAREFEILRYLAENQGRVISRERLYETIWGEDSFGCDNTVMVHIRHLREKIEDDPAAPAYIITMKGLAISWWILMKNKSDLNLFFRSFGIVVDRDLRGHCSGDRPVLLCVRDSGAGGTQPGLMARRVYRQFFPSA